MPGSETVKLDVLACFPGVPRGSQRYDPYEKSWCMARAEALSGVGQPPASIRSLLGINAGVYPSRLRCIRHRLPHARGLGR
jgi:hypothetical protein